jgi:hypothetical protein
VLQKRVSGSGRISARGTQFVRQVHVLRGGQTRRRECQGSGGGKKKMLWRRKEENGRERSGAKSWARTRSDATITSRTSLPSTPCVCVSTACRRVAACVRAFPGPGRVVDTWRANATISATASRCRGSPGSTRATGDNWPTSGVSPGDPCSSTGGSSSVPLASAAIETGAGTARRDERASASGR